MVVNINKYPLILKINRYKLYCNFGWETKHDSMASFVKFPEYQPFLDIIEEMVDF